MFICNAHVIPIGDFCFLVLKIFLKRLCVCVCLREFMCRSPRTGCQLPGSRVAASVSRLTEALGMNPGPPQEQ